ncbi:MAG: FAD-dependent oxidoreductase [Oceanicoccus sp.]
MNKKKICVVGGGPAGLTTTKTLVAAGHEVDCIEMSPYIGGHWVLENPNGRSAAYRSLTTNTTKNMSRFSDYELPEDWPTYPGHEQLRQWLESYVDYFSFRKRIQTSTEVVATQQRDDGGWTVTLRRGDSQLTEDVEYDALVAASGSYWDYQIPQWQGTFDGTIIHAQDYIDTDKPFATEGANVVVVGIGNTGCELSCEISRAGAASVHLSARGGAWILPRLIDGKPASDSSPMVHPCDPVPALFRWTPAAYRERLFEWVAGKKIRQMHAARMARFHELGLPPAPENPIFNRPTISDDILGYLERGAITAQPEIERLSGQNVIFANGESVRADFVLCATGYRLSFPYIDKTVVDTSDNDLNLFCGIVPPQCDNLFFIGVSRPLGSFWPLAEAQAQFVGELLAGRYRLPPAEQLLQRSAPALNRVSTSPGLYGLSLREELARGAC